MGDNAHRADLLSGPAHSPRTGLGHQTQREGIERPPGSAAAPGELMRLFVAIAPPPAVPTAMLTAAPRGPLPDAGRGRETALQPNRETAHRRGIDKRTRQERAGYHANGSAQSNQGVDVSMAVNMPCWGSNNSRRSSRTQATPSILSATPRRARP